jgi:S1-C subfamily serine protease
VNPGRRFAAILSIVLPAVYAQAAEEPLYSQLTRAVFRLQVHRSVCTAGQEKSAERLEALGTGFFVQDYLGPGPEPILWVVTARHVVEAANADLLARVRLGQTPPSDEWLYLPYAKWFFAVDGAKPPEIPTDVAIMPVRRADGYKAFTLCDGDNCPMQEPPATGREQTNFGEDPDVPEQVLLVGFPTEGPDVNALEPFARAGIVAYSSRDARLSIGGRPMFDLKAYVVDAFGWPGNSGGPLMNQPSPFSRGIRLLGLLTGSHFPVHDFGIVTPVSSIRTTLDTARSTGLAPVDAWRKEYPIRPRSCHGS